MCSNDGGKTSPTAASRTSSASTASSPTPRTRAAPWTAPRRARTAASRASAPPPPPAPPGTATPPPFPPPPRIRIRLPRARSVRASPGARVSWHRARSHARRARGRDPPRTRARVRRTLRVRARVPRGGGARRGGAPRSGPTAISPRRRRGGARAPHGLQREFLPRAPLRRREHAHARGEELARALAVPRHDPPPLEPNARHEGGDERPGGLAPKRRVAPGAEEVQLEDETSRVALVRLGRREKPRTTKRVRQVPHVLLTAATITLSPPRA